MTFPLMALAVGAIVAGFFGIPAALGGGNAIEEFLHPSFSVSHAAAVAGAESHAAAGEPAAHEPAAAEAGHATAAAEGEGHGEEHSTAVELGLMALKFYLWSPEISDRLMARFAGAHRLLTNKYYVDELYDATVISGSFSAGRGLWKVDRNVVDGAVNGTGWLTLFSAWLSGLTDKRFVDGAVNFVGWTAEELSYWFRRLQTGLVQNYALLMLSGVVVFIGLYWFMR